MPSPAPENVLRELSELWVALGEQGQTTGHAGVLRACSMTLVVLTEGDDDAAALGETIAALMPEHPARTIVVRLAGESDASLDARVTSQCWMPFGERRQICCEQIEVTAPDSSLPDLPPFIVPLAAADLPLILWCRSGRVAAHPAFDEIATIASKTVLDSASFPTAEDALRLLTHSIEQKRAVGDLAWTRLTRWREALGRVFDQPVLLERLPHISSARIASGRGEETSARYLAAWIEDALKQGGAHATTTIASGEALAATLSGEGIQIELGTRGGKLVISINGASECAALPPPGDYPMVREELAILRRDPVFEKTLAAAVRAAHSKET